MNFPNHSLWHHKEAESGITEEASSPSIIGSVESVANLPEVVTGADGPLISVISEDIGAVVEGIWVTVSLLWLDTVGSSEDSSIVIEVVAITSVGGLKSFIVPSWVE